MKTETTIGTHTSIQRKAAQTAPPFAEKSSRVSSDGETVSDPIDKVTLSGLDFGESENFANPFQNMFKAEASVSGNASRGRLNANLEAGASKFESVAAGRSGQVEVGGAQIQGAARGQVQSGAGAEVRWKTDVDLSQGKVSTDGRVGAGAQAGAKGQIDGGIQVGDTAVRGEAGGSARAGAEAEFRSRTDVDLSAGSIDSETRAAVGANARAEGHIAAEIEVGGITDRRELGASVEADAHAEVSGSLRADSEGIAASRNAEANASVSADVEASRRLSDENGNSLEAGVRGEAKLGAEAHANSHFESTADTLAFGGHAGASANASVMVEGDLNAETANGSAFSATGGTTWGSVGAGAGGDFSRRPGETSLGLEASGSIVGGAHFNLQAKVKDRDIAEASTLPIRGMAGAYNVIGDTADAVGGVTESAKQSAHQRQELLENMVNTPTGNFVTDLANGGVKNVHGAYTNAVDFADNAADFAGEAYGDAGRYLDKAVPALTDRVEEAVGSTLDAGVSAVNDGYRATRGALGQAGESLRDVGSAAGAGLVRGAGRLGSFLNPFD